MTNSNDLLAKQELLNSMDSKEVPEPGIPVDVFLQEAENLYVWAKDDEPALTNAGLSVELLNDLPIRAGACREAQSIWNKERNTREEAQQRWKDESPAAYELRDELIHTFLYAYRKHPDILARVQQIAEGDGYADMIQDLNDISVLGKTYPDPLKLINHDMTKLDKAGDESDQKAELLALSNGEKGHENESKIIRDKAYAHLKEAVDEIRACGKYVFWRNPDRLKGYSSAYYRKLNRNRDNKDNSME